MSEGESSDYNVEHEAFECGEFYENEDENEAGKWEGEEGDEEEPSVYYSEDFISGPRISEDGTLPENLFTFHHSFGYDCKRYFNLVAIEENVLIFASGNLIHFLDIDSNEIWFRRSAFGCGIGHIAKNPKSEYPHLAVAENGDKPPIIIYEWPSLQIVCLLKGGTAIRYTHLCYSPDGELLCSQGGEPDYLITVWNWKKHRILLRTKSYVNDVYNVMFSPTVPGQLTSSGCGHIKFWKMAQTFTGLKLQGEVGRFGKTEISDIIGLYPMPDEQVLSGSDWGNILVWDEGLISKEVSRKLNKNCHQAAITQFQYNDGELMTASLDGYVRMWYYDTIDLANPPEEARFVELEPSYEFHIGETKSTKTEIICLVKQHEDPQNTFWFAQDGNGGILLVDLSTEGTVAPSKRLFRCHAGHVIAVASSPWSSHIATLGTGGKLHIYNYKEKHLGIITQYGAKGRDMIWLPINADPTGSVIVMGFDDGVIRVIAVSINDWELSEPINNENYVFLIQVTKPHSKGITKLSLNLSHTVLISGSEDKTIFVYQLSPGEEFVELIPIGFINVPNVVTCLNWKPGDPATVLVGCLHGEFCEAELPTEPVPYTTISYELTNVKIQKHCFETCKSLIRREIKLEEINRRKEEKLMKKREELDKLIAANPGINFDEEAYLADSEEEEELEALFIPEVPNPVLFAMYTPEDTIWLSMGGYDAGYIYEYKFGVSDPVMCTMVHDGDDIEIHCYLFDHKGDYLILGMQDGKIRVVRFNPQDFRDLTDYWTLSMHDNFNGKINGMCFSYNEKHFFTVGDDGNIFSYEYNPEHNTYFTPDMKPIVFENPIHVVEDICASDVMSLEEVKQKGEYDLQMAIANEHKAIVINKLNDMMSTFRTLLQRNKQLLPSQIIPHDDFLLDERITDDMENSLQEEYDLMMRKMAFDVEKSHLGFTKLMDHFVNPISIFPFTIVSLASNFSVTIIRQKRLDENFQNAKETVRLKIEEEEGRLRKVKYGSIDEGPPPELEKKLDKIESFLIGFSPSTIEFRLTAKIQRLLARYRARRNKIEERKKQWDELLSKKPLEGVNHPDDEVNLEAARSSVGDFKLKSAPDYRAPEHSRQTTLQKYKQLLEARERAFNVRNNFNLQLCAMRERKVNLIIHIMKLRARLQEIQTEIPESQWCKLPDIPRINFEIAFPEYYFNIDHILSEKPKEQIYFPSEPKKETESICDPPKVDFYYEKRVFSNKHLACTYEQKMSHVLKNICPTDYNRCSEIPLDTMQALAEKDDEETLLEQKLKKMRLKKKLDDQFRISSEVERLVTSFDTRLKELQEEKLHVHFEGLLLDNHIITLNQELIILKEFETYENKLTEIVQNNEEVKADIVVKMGSLKNKIEMMRQKIENYQTRMKEIQERFNTIIVDNNFSTYLKKIFKKKYREQKIKREDDESSESSSSESSTESDEDEDVQTITSRDLATLRVDDTVCPKGCDQAIFDLTLSLRNNRHKYEIDEREALKVIESYQRELDAYSKSMKNIEATLKNDREELLVYQHEKQRKLNDVESLVILNLDQMQHLVSEKEVASLKDTLLFSKRALSLLYKRVGELQNETFAQRAIHKKNKTHLKRMKTDCAFMERRIFELKRDIRDMMCLKFGRVISLDEMHHAVLRKLVYDLRLSMADIKNEYEKQLNEWKEKYKKKQTELAEVIQENTYRLNLLIVLEEEKNKLDSILEHQLKNEGKIESKFDDVCLADIEKLKRISKTQQLQIQALKDEIKILRMKSKPLETQQEVKPLHQNVKLPGQTDEVFIYNQIVSQIKEKYSSVAGQIMTPFEEMLTELNEFLVQENIGKEKYEKIVQHIFTYSFENIYRYNWIPYTEVFHNFYDNIISTLDWNESKVADRDKKLKPIIDQFVNDLLDLSSDVTPCPGIHEDIQEEIKEEMSKEESIATKEEVVQEILSECLDSLLLSCKTPTLQDCIESILKDLIRKVPIDVIMDESSLTLIVKEINNLTLSEKGSAVINVEEITQNVLDSFFAASEEHIRMILNEIVDRFLVGELLPFDEET